MGARWSWMSGILLGMASCSSGGGGGGPSGTFLDSAVEGLTATSGTTISVTDAQGRFSYASGQAVTFSVGDVVLGVAQGAAIVTPLDLSPGAVDETDPTVTNIARFLQTVDSDLDPDNGIVIDAAVQQAAMGVTIDFTQPIAQFEATEQAQVDTLTAGLPGGARPLVSAAQAQAHLARTLRSVVAGRYEGSYSGDDSGPFEVFVDRDGNLFGWAISDFDGLIGLSGGADVDGGFLAGNASTGATFSGQIEPDGTLSGTWSLSPESGTFQGRRTISLDVDLDEALIDQLAGSYAGTSTSGGITEPETLTLDDDGNIAVPPPGERIAGTIYSTSGTRAEIFALTDEGCVIQGTFELPGNLTGDARNDYEGERATFTLQKQ